MKSFLKNEIVMNLLAVIAGIAGSVIFYIILLQLFDWIDEKLFPIGESDFLGGKSAAIGALTSNWIHLVSSCLMGGLIGATISVSNTKVLTLIIGIIIALIFLIMIYSPDYSFTPYDLYLNKKVIIWETTLILIIGAYCGGLIGIRIKRKRNLSRAN